LSAAVPIPGRRAVTEVLRSGKRKVAVLWIAAGNRAGPVSEIRSLAARRGVEVREADREELDRLAGTEHHQGVVAMAERGREASVEELIARAAAAGEPAFIVALDEVKDPQNVGAVIRTAESAGAHGLVITEYRSAPLAGGVERASAGAVEYLPVATVANLRDALERMKKAGCWVVGTDASAPRAHTGASLDRPVVVVLGEEGRGLRELTARTCDELVAIPMRGKVGSLNVSAAAAVMCYEVVRQRDTGGRPVIARPGGGSVQS